MTRKLLSLALVALLAMAASAQDLAGRWQTNIDIDDDTYLILEFDLNADKSANLTFFLGGKIQLDKENVLEMLIRSTANDAKWENEKNLLSFDINTQNIQYEISKLNINGEDIGSLRSLFEPEMLKEGKSEFDSYWQLFNENAFIVLDHNDTTLELSDGEDKYTFVRK